MTPTVVIDAHGRSEAELSAPDVVYVGRALPRDRRPTVRKGSPFANPRRLKGDLRAYRAHVLASPELVALLPSLRGKRLACWCCETYEPIDTLPDRLCHAEVLADLADGRESPI